MARIAGVDLPNNKRVEIGLTYIYGIGLTTAKKIISETGHPFSDRKLPVLQKDRKPMERRVLRAA